MRRKVSVRKMFVLLAGMMIAFSVSSVKAAEVIRLSADKWCPYLCDPKTDAGKEGYLPDMAIRIFQDAGYEVRIEHMPYPRGTKMCEQGTMNGICGVYKMDVPDFIFPDNEQGMSINVFLVRKENPWNFTGEESMKSLKKIGVLLGYEAFPGIESFMKNNPQKLEPIAITDRYLERFCQMILRDRIDCLIDDRYVINYTLNKTEMSDRFREAGYIDVLNPLYIAFSPVIPESEKYARVLSEGMEKLRKSGELKEILATYGLTDWREK